LEKFKPTEAMAQTDETKKPEVPKNENPLVTAYRLVHEQEPPADMPMMEVAFLILEVLDNPNWVPRDLAIQCGDEIMGMRNRANPKEDARAIILIRNLEEGIAQNLFPALKGIDEVHYTQWAEEYEKYKAEESNSQGES
jgi:hypothetical protein